ncbi:HAD family phosphatase [Ornithinimicrobium sp. Arc0846-15]|nr:HAD family phosphatase [Ornithinimicrobium laminariae]
MDGTLIDTEPYWIAEEKSLVADAGGVWTDEDAHQLVGNPLAVSAQILIDNTPVTGSVEAIVNRLLTRVVHRVKHHMPWRPGARDLLMELNQTGVPCALVTMSYTELAEILIEELPPGTFSTVITGDIVANGKPHPEPYLTAVAALQVLPGECVAIEDSPTGTKSAVAAGVPTIAVPHTVPVPHITGSVQVDSLLGVSAADLSQLVSAAAFT